MTRQEQFAARMRAIAKETDPTTALRRALVCAFEELESLGYDAGVAALNDMLGRDRPVRSPKRAVEPIL